MINNPCFIIAELSANHQGDINIAIETIRAAKRAGADAYVTADMKYHDFYQAENSILLCDIGHYESEQYTKDLLVDVLTKKISNFAIVLSQTNTNPISYF